MNNPIQNLSRRGFLQGAAGLTLGLSLPAFAAKAGAAAAQAAAPFEPTPFLRIGADNSVTVLSKHLEMGQGVRAFVYPARRKHRKGGDIRHRQKRIGGTLAVKLMISVVEDHSRIAANPPKVAERSFIYIAREEKSMRGSTHI